MCIALKKLKGSPGIEPLWPGDEKFEGHHVRRFVERPRSPPIRSNLIYSQFNTATHVGGPGLQFCLKQKPSPRDYNS